jgi:S-DNA-T family DNA segregation ATPase FtsK/SpoIIIE
VVLRAARLETNALELLGLVLARRLVADSLPASIRPVGWLLLDDFGNWLGHREGEVADLLAVVLHDGDGEPTVELFVVESKFVGEAACSEEARKSRRQLERTMDGLIHRLFNGENPLARPIWLRRLADLMLGHVEPFDHIAGRNLAEWAELVAGGGARLCLRGLSAVFVYDAAPTAENDVQIIGPVQGQAIIRRVATVRLLRRLHPDSNGPDLRLDLPPA